MSKAIFIGYRFMQAEFVVYEDERLPEGSHVSCDTLRALKIPVPSFPTWWQWKRMLWKLSKTLALLFLTSCQRHRAIVGVTDEKKYCLAYPYACVMYIPERGGWK